MFVFFSIATARGYVRQMSINVYRLSDYYATVSLETYNKHAANHTNTLNQRGIHPACSQIVHGGIDERENNNWQPIQLTKAAQVIPILQFRSTFAV